MDHGASGWLERCRRFHRSRCMGCCPHFSPLPWGGVSDRRGGVPGQRRFRPARPPIPRGRTGLGQRHDRPAAGADPRGVTLEPPCRLSVSAMDRASHTQPLEARLGARAGAGAAMHTAFSIGHRRATAGAPPAGPGTIPWPEVGVAAGVTVAEQTGADWRGHVRHLFLFGWSMAAGPVPAPRTLSPEPRKLKPELPAPSRPSRSPARPRRPWPPVMAVVPCWPRSGNQADTELHGVSRNGISLPRLEQMPLLGSWIRSQWIGRCRGRSLKYHKVHQGHQGH